MNIRYPIYEGVYRILTLFPYRDILNFFITWQVMIFSCLRIYGWSFSSPIPFPAD